MQVDIAEIKAWCDDPVAALDRMRELGAQHQGRDHQVDTYYKGVHGRLKLRRGTVENSLIHYNRGDRSGPKDSHVTLYHPSDPPALLEVLNAALDVLVVVDKHRDILWADNVKLHVDQVSGLGSFVEIEAIDRDRTRSRDQLHRQCRRWLDALGIDPVQLVARSYSDLLLAGRSRQR